MGSRKEELSAAHDTITQLQVKLEEAKGEPLKFNEKEREAQEKKTKDAEKKADEAKRAAKLKKKEKLSDILMAHGAEFLAMKAAKDNADAGDKKQKDEVTKAAKSGARAGAVGPLRKVARAAAVAAVKKSRAEAKKDKRNDKAKIREITTAAAQVAVKKLLAEQEELVEKTVKTVTAKAIKKYPPALSLADEDDDTPNEFVAPPSIHLSLDGLGADTSEVEELEKDSAKNSAKDTEKANAKVAKAAAQAKQDAGAVVPEK